MEPVNLHTALEQIAERFGFDFSDLAIYAGEDDIGGYAPPPLPSKWPIGSIFEVEGKALYALTRALKPVSILNLGAFHGCSVAHFAAALKANGNDKARVYAVDMTIREWPLISDELNAYIVPVESDGLEYLNKRWPAKVGICFEDMIHSAEQVQAVWEVCMHKMSTDAMMISHDSLHWVVGDDVMSGIVMAGAEDALSLLISPSDCGLSLWMKPTDE